LMAKIMLSDPPASHRAIHWSVAFIQMFRNQIKYSAP
jgi:hypothetical protein